jgi:hypothetical protein
MTKETLKQEILQAVSEGDIAKLYMMEQKANDIFNENEVSGYYKNILDLALERLTDILEAKRKANMQDVQDFSTIRALYEYAMEHYHAGKKTDAAALFEILSGISDDETFSKSLKVHTASARKGISLDDFLEKYADLDATQRSGNFYICEFTKKAQDLLDTPKEESK